MNKSALILLGAMAPAALSMAQVPVTPQSTKQPVFSVYLRERGNATQWFSALPNAEQYGHGDSLLRLSIAQRLRRFDWQLEMSNSSELVLPTDAVSPIAAQGQLGLGGTYYASNSNNSMPAAVTFKTGFARYHFGDGASNALRAGRFEFFDGQEMTLKNASMLWLQNNRVAQRLIGNFGFSNGQRSLDGLDLKFGGKNWDVTAMGARADQGVFKMAANEELNVDAQYLAYTRTALNQHVLFRGFGIAYHDGRTGIVKTDNRPLAVRLQDHRNIRIGTYGGDIIAMLPVAKNTFDLIVWGLGQNGNWGKLDHKAGAFLVEGGFHAEALPTKPWLRGGMVRTTGDNNPMDGKHNTFSQILPTPRNYARYPFFNMMNSSEQFIMLLDKPTAKMDIRTDLHFLSLTAKNDLWYQGGGPYDNKVFGFQGRPANGHHSFAALYDVSMDYALSRQFSLTTYYARAFGKSVVAAIYPRERNSNYGYFELTYRLSKPLGR